MKTVLEAWEQSWTTEMGAYFPGERVVLRGKDLFTELQDLSWMGLLIYGVTGRLPDANQERLLNGIWALGTSYPDPRIWNNRIGALAGAAGSTSTLGVSAGLAVTEALLYGLRPLLGAAGLLLEAQRKLERGETLEEMLANKLNKASGCAPASGQASKKRHRLAALPGFGRPVSSRDERIAPLLELAGKLACDRGPAVKLAFSMEKVLQQSGYRHLYLNVAGLMAALLTDQGYTPQQQYQLCVLCSSGGILFCAADAATHPPGSFFPMRCASIDYHGTAPRQWRTETI
ncbi:hypothetical protein FKG94_02320 [Exilibacterium tricleocarpae]|uniref:Uncharacterized protein n=1 Tax=Exilibacterium tricleocarpae TaxID=2591008 RepID=A0A545U8B7_9GAMM|nr:hypothetical protein [Exilibacterium tricleocarpae]TQV85698.1 hypothetical protein FKG94_02320 [Exilibacterium tricleocarpae]